MTLFEYWRSLPRYGKCIFWISIALGFVFLILGLILDTKKFWDAWGFGANIATSFVSALFGVPLAVVVIGWFTSSHSSRIESMSINKLTTTAWRQFRDAATRCSPPAITESLQRETRAIETAYRELVAYLDLTAALGEQTPLDSNYPYPSELKLRDEAGTTVDELRSTLVPYMHSILAATGRLRGAVGFPPEFERDWAVLQSKWAFLASDVCVLRLGADLRWIPIQHEAAFDHRIRDAESPLSAVHDSLLNLERFAQHVDRQIQGSFDEMVNATRSGGSGIYFSPEGLIAKADEARGVLLEIREAALEADRDNWINEHL